MLPNFLIIGASKAGTTSLHEYLGQHPDIFMSAFKEPGFFTFAGTGGRFPKIQHERFVTDPADYEALFDGVDGQSIVGESSTFYLDYASEAVVKRIQTLLPAPRLLVVLRQPVDQAYSRYVMLRRDGRSVSDEFRSAFLADFRTYRDLAYDFHANQFLTKSYCERLRVFMDKFAAGEIKVFLYDDLVSDAAGLVNDAFRFLGVDENFKPDLERRSNTGSTYRSTWIGALMNRPNPVRWAARKFLPRDRRIRMRNAIVPLVSTSAPPLDATLRAELSRLLDEEIDGLEALLDRNLSAWRAPA